MRSGVRTVLGFVPLLALLALGAAMLCADRDWYVRRRIERLEWTAMDTCAAVQCRGGDQEAAKRLRTRVADSFDWVARTFNRFDATSEVRRLSPLADGEVLAAADVSECYAAAFDLMRRSGGAFNPRWGGPRTLDLGAIAKGYAVDVAATNLVADADILIDLGGNLKSVRGNWRTGVRDPSGDGYAANVELRTGEALATSATYYRGRHIFDGRTGIAVTNGVASVTVLHPASAMMADGLSTTLFVLGPEAGLAFVREHAPEAAVLWVMEDASCVSFDPSGRFRVLRVKSKQGGNER